MDTWVLVALVVPGIALILGATVLTFRAHAEGKRTARMVHLGFAVLYLIPAGAFVVLVLLGRLHPVVLIAAGVLIGDALLRIRAWGSN
jgi:hypothetical protein